MGVGVFPVFNPRLPEARFTADGKVLAAEFEVLDALAQRNGLPLFSSYGDNRPIPEGFDGDPDELDDLMGEFNEWFDAADAIEGFSALIGLIQKGQSPEFTYSDEQVVEELQELISVLRTATEKGARFHLEMA